MDARLMRSRLRPIAYVALIAFTIASFIVITLRLRLDPNISALLPDSGNAAAMKRYVRGFGGGDLGVVMVKGESPEENAKIADQITAEIRKRPSVEQAAARVDTSHTLDPMLAWRHADARARERLAQALTPEGMRKRLADTRAMLLAPGLLGDERRPRGGSAAPRAARLRERRRGRRRAHAARRRLRDRRRQDVPRPR
ncbi:MAG: hypothetical protein V9F03_05310 [Microthrixaceae bacterium]